MMERDGPRGRRSPQERSSPRIRARTTTTNKPPAPAMAMLGEVVVHGRDIRHPLGIPDDTSSESKLACLDMFKGSNFPVPTKKDDRRPKPARDRHRMDLGQRSRDGRTGARDRDGDDDPATIGSLRATASRLCAAD